MIIEETEWKELNKFRPYSRDIPNFVCDDCEENFAIVFMGSGKNIILCYSCLLVRVFK